MGVPRKEHWFFIVSDKPSRPRTRFHGRADPPHPTPCAHDGCAEKGEFRAPRGDGARDGERWRWLCLDHVRAFNATYDYFAGMDMAQIERAQRVYAGWESETRAFATNGAGNEPKWSRFVDPADILSERFGPGGARANASTRFDPAEQRALKTLGLAENVTLHDVRRAYTMLVRRYHPDHNGGDRRHEQALQAVISAYTHLKTAPAFKSRS
jgi:hypothetical protein